MPWVLCTGPLTLFLLLVVLARVRGRDIDEEELEEAAIATTFAANPAPAEGVRSETPALAFDLPPANGDGAWAKETTWGGSEWGGATAVDTNYTAPNNSGSAQENDPWRASW